jgi:hypothetical protein
MAGVGVVAGPTGAALSVAMIQGTRARIEERRHLHRGSKIMPF